MSMHYDEFLIDQTSIHDGVTYRLIAGTNKYDRVALGFNVVEVNSGETLLDNGALIGGNQIAGEAHAGHDHVVLDASVTDDRGLSFGHITRRPGLLVALGHALAGPLAPLLADYAAREDPRGGALG